jgi:hypothetical protein
MPQQINLTTFAPGFQGIVIEGGLTGLQNKVMTVNDSGTGFELLDATNSLSVTAPLNSTGGSEPVISLGGLATLGTDGQLVGSGGTNWGYVNSTGTGDVVRAQDPTLGGTGTFNELVSVGGSLKIQNLDDDIVTLDDNGISVGAGTLTIDPAGVITSDALAGSGTRITTSTSTGVQGNATSIDGNYEFVGSVYAGAGFTGLGANLNSDLVVRAGFDTLLRVNTVSLEVGVFGSTATQQSITTNSVDPAVTELQNIMIAYGLATDNR